MALLETKTKQGLQEQWNSCARSLAHSDTVESS